MDKTQFALLVSWVTGKLNGSSLDKYDIDELDKLVTLPVPEPVKVQVDIGTLDNLLYLMQQGTRKIEAIKEYRTLTGAGLLEAKNAVEKCWDKVDKPNASV